MIEQIVNSAVYDLTHNEDGSELEIIYTNTDQAGGLPDGDSQYAAAQQNQEQGSPKGSIMIYTITKKRQTRLSLGSLIGSKLLSQTGPYFNFDIVPVAVINVGYNTEFESAGINQSKYKVYLNVKTETRLLVPFMSEKFRTEKTVSSLKR